MGDESTWGQHEGTKPPSFLLEEQPCLTAAGRGGWEIAGPRCRANQTVVLVVVGMSEGQGPLARSLRGEPKGLHGSWVWEYSTLPAPR